MKNEKLQAFITEAANAKPNANGKLELEAEPVRAAAEFIESRLKASSAGGLAARGRSGPKVKLDTPEAVKNRERVRKFRKKKAE